MKFTENKYMKCHKIGLFAFPNTHQYCQSFQEYLLECWDRRLLTRIAQALRLNCLHVIYHEITTNGISLLMPKTIFLYGTKYVIY